MKKTNFLDKAKDSNPLISEQRVLDSLAKLNKAVVISMDSKDNIQKYFLDIKSEVERASISDIHHFVIGDSGIVSTSIIGKSRIDDIEFHNLIDVTFKDYKGYCFIVNSGISYMMCDGIIDSEIGGSLLKFRTMQEIVNMKKNVCDLREVFENFYSACKYQKIYYDECFEASGKIRAEIKEQELRNILMKYLNQHVRGEVQSEFCTDYVNDAESVDIYLNDGIETAIIEVKFSFAKSYYLGSTYYNLKKRVGDGISQLDKYAQHLEKDNRQVHYGYVYMFYCNNMTEKQISDDIDSKYNEMKSNLSPAFFSIYKCTITNNMQFWGVQG